jgi:hypothetical protein
MEKGKPTTPSGVNVKAASVPAMETPMATPAPAPIATPAPAPVPAAIDSLPPAMADGGNVSKGNAFTDFFNGWNWLEIGLMTLGVAGVFYTINYYRYRTKSDKTENADIKRQLDEVKMNVQSAMKGKYQQI